VFAEPLKSVTQEEFVGHLNIPRQSAITDILDDMKLSFERQKQYFKCLALMPFIARLQPRPKLGAIAIKARLSAHPRNYLYSGGLRLYQLVFIPKFGQKEY
jgi:hypothetical protein